MSKKILISDLHFGNAGNSPKHNQDIIEFFNWVIDNSNDIEEIVILGDTFHQRDKLSVDSINYAIKGIELLASHFSRVVMLVGNHDMFFRDTRETNSCNIFKHISNVEIIEDFKHEGNVSYVSWICNGEEYDKIIKETKQNKTKYMLAHLELSSFSMNDHYIMEHGQSHKELSHVERVFTGHYHGRQIRDNVVYIGNPFPFDFNDANDMNKGFCVLDTETGEYEFVNYEKIAVIDLTPEQLLEQDWSEFEQDNISVRVVADDNVSHETLDQIKEMFEGHSFRNTKLVYNNKSKKENGEEVEDIDVDEIMSVDQIVMHYIDNMDETEKVKPSLLREIYQSTYS